MGGTFYIAYNQQLIAVMALRSSVKALYVIPQKTNKEKNSQSFGSCFILSQT